MRRPLVADVGRRIRHARRAAGLSLAEVARRTEGDPFAISAGRLSRFERGLADPDVAVVEPIAKALGVEWRALLVGTVRGPA